MNDDATHCIVARRVHERPFRLGHSMRVSVTNNVVLSKCSSLFGYSLTSRSTHRGTCQRMRTAVLLMISALTLVGSCGWLPAVFTGESNAHTSTHHPLVTSVPCHRKCSTCFLHLPSHLFCASKKKSHERGSHRAKSIAMCQSCRSRSDRQLCSRHQCPPLTGILCLLCCRNAKHARLSARR